MTKAVLRSRLMDGLSYYNSGDINERELLDDYEKLVDEYANSQAEPQVSLDAKLMLLAKDIVEKYGSGCPNCNDEGFIVVNGGSFMEPELEREQCEFCYYEPKSRFNLMADLEKLIKVSKQSN